MVAGAAIAILTDPVIIAKLLDFAMLWLAENPELEPEFQAGLNAYKKAVAEGRDLTEEEIQAVEANRKRILGEPT